MNLIHKFYYAIKKIGINKKMEIFTVVIITTAFMMLYSSAVLFEGLDYGEKSVKNSLSTPVPSCGVVQFQDNLDEDKREEFVSRIYALDEIKAIGTYGCYGMSGLSTDGKTDYWNRMLEIQNSGELEFKDDNSSNMQMVMMNSELFDMIKFDLIKGDKLQVDEPERYRLFLGYNFREIPVGTIFKDDNFSCEVSGIMKKGTYITDPELFTWNLRGLTMAYKVKMDNMMLMLLPEGEVLNVRNIFCVNDGYTYKDAVSAVENLGKEQEVQLRTGTMQARLDSVFSENKKIKRRIDLIALIICISVFAISVTVQLLSIYMKRNELGIWLANGMSRKEVFAILWLEDLIKILIGGVLAVILERILIHVIFWNNRSVFLEVVSIMYGKSLLELMIFGLLLTCIISIIPVMFIARKPTTELVKGVWN